MKSQVHRGFHHSLQVHISKRPPNMKQGLVRTFISHLNMKQGLVRTLRDSSVGYEELEQGAFDSRGWEGSSAEGAAAEI